MRLRGMMEDGMRDDALIDGGRPDPFGVPGYLGVIPADDERQFGRDQARYAFPNGFGAGVLFGGPLSCDVCQSEARPYEMHQTHGPDMTLCDLPFGHVCGVDAVGVRAWLGKIAALPPADRCDHGRQ